MILVYVNGVKLDVSAIGSVSVRYDVVPSLSACNIELYESGGRFIVGSLRTKKTEYKDLLNKSISRGVKQDYYLPVFKDNDVVHVFERRKDGWWWLFHGFVTNVSYNLSSSGEEKIQLHCESGLKSLKRAFLAVNSFRVPEELTSEELGSKVEVLIDVFQNVPFSQRTMSQKLRVLFEGGGIAKERKLTGEGEFKVISKIVSTEEDVWKYVDDLKSLSKIGNVPESVIDSVVQNNYDPQKKNIYLLLLGDGNVIDRLYSIVLGKWTLSPPPYVDKLSVLNQIINPVNYIAYTLPCGHVVVEPLFNGIVDEEEVIEDNDLRNLSYTFSGSDIVTAVITSYGPNILGKEQRSVRQDLTRWQTFPVVMDEDAVRAYGLRMMDMVEEKMVIETEEIAREYAKFLLSRSWSMAKTASVSAIWRGKGGLNRPLLVGKIKASFLVVSMSVDVQSSGAKEVSYSLGYGLTWDGKDWSVDMKWGRYSLLSFLSRLKSILKIEDKKFVVM